MRAVDLVIVICWVAFWAYWLLAASRATSGQGRWSRFAGIRVGIVIVVVYLVRAFGFRSHPVKNDPVLTGIGLALVLIGLYSATREEAYLAGEFPDAYPAYKRSTKMLIPFIF